jgi:hypothetical protein
MNHHHHHRQFHADNIKWVEAWKVLDEPYYVQVRNRQLASNKVLGIMKILGANLNAYTIVENPDLGVVKVFWVIDDQEYEATFPVLERDDVMSTWLLVGVVEDPAAYSLSTFFFNGIEYYDAVVESWGFRTAASMPFSNTDCTCCPGEHPIPYVAPFAPNYRDPGYHQPFTDWYPNR